VVKRRQGKLWDSDKSNETRRFPAQWCWTLHGPPWEFLVEKWSPHRQASGSAQSVDFTLNSTSVLQAKEAILACHCVAHVELQHQGFEYW
tara:strand:+ start:492 stop:761 length:270 start_codon:yes stop_codon:yes gene_type:complete